MMEEMPGSPWQVEQYRFSEHGVGHGFVMRQTFAEGGPKWVAYFISTRTGDTFNVWFHTDDEALAAVNRLADAERKIRQGVKR